MAAVAAMPVAGEPGLVRQNSVSGLLGADDEDGGLRPWWGMAPRCLAATVASLVVGLLLGLLVPRLRDASYGGVGAVGRASAWAPLPPADAILTRVAFGSCADQKLAQPFWDVLWDLQPDLTILGGDTVYGDCENAHCEGTQDCAIQVPPVRRDGADGDPSIPACCPALTLTVHRAVRRVRRARAQAELPGCQRAAAYGLCGANPFVLCSGGAGTTRKWPPWLAIAALLAIAAPLAVLAYTHPLPLAAPS